MTAPACAVMHAPTCTREIAMLDRKGYVYCLACGLRRRATGTACRRLTQADLEALRAGRTVSWRKAGAA